MSRAANETACPSVADATKVSARADLSAQARGLAAAVVDPELPMLTLADLGVLRSVDVDGRRVVVTITPTYTGCPAMAAMRDDLVRALAEGGFCDVEVRVGLRPAWSSDWISETGRRALAVHGISAPGPAPRRAGPVPLALAAPSRRVRCPRCDSNRSELISEFGSTSCRAIYRCLACLDSFDHIKEI